MKNSELPKSAVLSQAVAAARAGLDLGARTRAVLEAAVGLPSAVLAVGKGAGLMADAAAAALDTRNPPDAARAIAVHAICPDGYAAPQHPRVIHHAAPHPLPDDRTARLAALAMDLARISTPQAPLWLLLSGGGSAALGAPLAPLDVAGLAAVTSALMVGGASIGQLNTVRQHLCDVVGGRLGNAAGGLFAVVCVDVPDGNLAYVASGPALAAPLPTTPPETLLAGAGHPGLTLHAPPPCPPWPHRVALDPAAWLTAVQHALAQQGVHAQAGAAHVLTSPAQLAAALVEPLVAQGGLRLAVAEVPFAIPAHAPPGGRCAHACLWLGRQLAATGRPFVVLAAASDGRDGPTEQSGAVLDSAALARFAPDTVSRALAAGATTPLLASAGALLPRVASGVNVLDVVVTALAPPPGHG